jgi:hypothetical protein
LRGFAETRHSDLCKGRARNGTCNRALSTRFRRSWTASLKSARPGNPASLALGDARRNECRSTFSLNEPTCGFRPENGAQANDLLTGRATFSRRAEPKTASDTRCEESAEPRATVPPVTSDRPLIASM